jgi:hypothetical protein
VSRSRVGTLVCLVVLVAAAVVLRVWALDLGLPNVAARPDEREMLRHTAGFPQGDLNPRWFVYPNFFLYAVWLWEEAVLRVRGLWIETPSYSVMLQLGLPRLLLYGRAFSALVGSATVLLVFAIGRRLGGTSLGLVAAALLAVNWLHVRDSHALKTEPLLAAAVVWSLWRLARFVEVPGPRRAALAGVAIGIATACKYPGIFLLGPAWVASALVSPRPGWRRWLPSRELVLIASVALATFLAACPYIVLDYARTLDTASFLSVALYANRPEHAAAADTGMLGPLRAWLGSRALGYHVTVSLRWGCGLAFALATPLALIATARTRRPFFILATAFSGLWLAIAGLSPVHLARYFTPLVPTLCLCVAAWVVGLARHPPAKVRPAVLAAVTLLLCAEPLARSVAANRVGAETDTRVLATEWMAKNLPRTAVVAQLGSAIIPLIGDPELPPGVKRVLPAPGDTDLDHLHVTHVTTHEHVLPFSRLDPAQMAAVAPRLEQLAEFSPWRDGPAGAFEREDAYYVPFYDFAGVERPGPLVRVYAVRKPLAAIERAAVTDRPLSAD